MTAGSFFINSYWLWQQSYAFGKPTGLSTFRYKWYKLRFLKLLISNVSFILCGIGQVYFAFAF